MNKLELIKTLFSSPHEEVLIELDGVAYEIDGFGEVEEEFDGFYTVYPAAVTIKIKNNE